MVCMGGCTCLADAGPCTKPAFSGLRVPPAFRPLVTHYWRHAGFLEEDQLIRDAPKLNGIPGVLIHGRYDVSGPLVTAWRLSQRWTTCRLQVLDDAGHGGGESFVPTVIDALNAFGLR